MILWSFYFKVKHLHNQVWGCFLSQENSWNALFFKNIVTTSAGSLRDLNQLSMHIHLIYNLEVHLIFPPYISKSW